MTDNASRAKDEELRIELLQVSGDIHGSLRASVDAADAAGSEEADACQLSQHHGSGNGGSAYHAGCDIGRYVPAADLANGFRFAHDFQLV